MQMAETQSLHGTIFGSCASGQMVQFEKKGLRGLDKLYEQSSVIRGNEMKGGLGILVWQLPGFQQLRVSGLGFSPSFICSLQIPSPLPTAVTGIVAEALGSVGSKNGIRLLGSSVRSQSRGLERLEGVPLSDSISFIAS